MSSDFGSIFHFVGKISDMKMKISLFKKSPVGDINPLFESTSSSIVCDEVNCYWAETISRLVSPGYDRIEPRIFTTVGKDTESTTEASGKPSRQVMNICAFLGDIGDLEPSSFHDVVICRITLYKDRTLTFEPPLTASGYRLESKLGDYQAKVQVWDDQFSSLADGFSRLDLLNLPDAGEFDLGEEDSLTLMYNMNITTAVDFDFDGISIKWKLLGNSSDSQQVSGSTSRCFKTKEEIFCFSHAFSLSLSVPFSIFSSGFQNPTLFFELISEDGWGRQWIAGYGLLALPVTAGKHLENVHCWRPFKKDGISQLTEFFVGSSVELDSEKVLKNSLKTFGLHTESSGSLKIEVTTIIHSRHFMSKDTLQHVKYGTRLGQIGLKSDLYWRIMKVLLEFEEARQALLQIRKAT